MAAGKRNTRTNMIKSLTIFSGNANRDLAEAICRCLEVRLGSADIVRFADGEVYVELRENVRGGNCFVVQPTCTPVNEAPDGTAHHLDALKRASAGSIIAVIPTSAMRGRIARSTRPRSQLTGCRLLTVAGAQPRAHPRPPRGQIQGFFQYSRRQPLCAAGGHRLPAFGTRRVVTRSLVAPDAAASSGPFLLEAPRSVLAIIDKAALSAQTCPGRIIGDVPWQGRHHHRRHDRHGGNSGAGGRPASCRRPRGASEPAPRTACSRAKPSRASSVRRSRSDHHQHDSALGGGESIQEDSPTLRRPSTRRSDKAYHHGDSDSVRCSMCRPRQHRGR